MEGSLPVQSQFTVGISVEGKGDRLVFRAEDALIAALKVKPSGPRPHHYVRRLNRRGDARHPPHRLAETAISGPRISRLAKAILSTMYYHRDLAGRHGRIAFADCQAHVQTLPNIDEPSF